MTGSVLFMTHVGDAGGAELKMVDLCRALGTRAEVLLLQNGSLERLLDAHQIRYSVCKMPERTGGVRREAGLASVLKAVPGALSMIWKVARRTRSASVVVCFSQKSFVIASLAKPLMRRPIFWFMNDILSAEHFSPRLIRILMLLARFSANHVAVNSQASLRHWIEAGGRKSDVSVIYPGTFGEQMALQLSDPQTVVRYRKRFSPDSRPLVGMFGRICRWKGQEVFLRALALVPEAKGVVVGGALFGEEETERGLRKLAAELGIGDRVVFTGHLSDVMAVMAACDVVAHCSTSAEPFGLVIAEAMHVGTPVIASDAGGAREIVGRGANRAAHGPGRSCRARCGDSPLRR